jgi:glycosyltransferase involved in cell wall biosynthesis
MNSSIGFELLNRYGRAIKDAGCITVVHNFAFPEDNGLMIEAFPSFPASLEFIDFVVVDSMQHKKLISEIYGLPEGVITKVPLPMTEGLIQKTSMPTKRILFANRLAREKQPQVALDVARKLAKSGIYMDIYGTKDIQFCNEIQFDERVVGSPNVSYKKSFNGTKKLNFNDYDICFMPSLYEGIPRIALDSLKANLFVICSSVGGLPEIIVDGENGILLPPNSAVDDFATAIMKYYNNKSLQDLEKRKNINKKIIELHSYEHHTTLLEGIYIDNHEGQ